LRAWLPHRVVLRWLLTVSPILLYALDYLRHPERGWSRELMFARRYWKGFGWKVEYDAPLDPKNQYLFAGAPHGVIPLGLNALLNDPSYPLALGARVQFWVPIVRDFMMAFGVVDANRQTFQNALAAGRSVAIVPGGVREMMMSHPSMTKLKLNSKNSGFCVEAFRYGVPLVPVFSFGEHNFYDQRKLNVSMEWQLRIKKLLGGVHPFIPVGRDGGLMPCVVNHTVVYGKPIPVPKKESPTPEEVNALRIQFYHELMKLVYKWRIRVGYPELEVHCIERDGSRLPPPLDLPTPLPPSSSTPAPIAATTVSPTTTTTTTITATVATGKRANL